MVNERKIDEEIFRACSEASRESFLELIQHNRERYVKDAAMPYSLCVIEIIPVVGWAATGFISDYISRFVFSWVRAKASFDRTNLISFLQNPFSNGLFGTVFEDWARHSIGARAKEFRLFH